MINIERSIHEYDSVLLKLEFEIVIKQDLINAHELGIRINFVD